MQQAPHFKWGGLGKRKWSNKGGSGDGTPAKRKKKTDDDDEDDGGDAALQRELDARQTDRKVIDEGKLVNVSMEDIARTIPSSLWEQLHPYQKEAVQYHVERKGRGLACLDQGLGKTPTVIAICLYYFYDLRVLWLTRKSLLAQTKDEWIRWSGCSPDDVYVIKSRKDIKWLDLKDEKTLRTLVQYDQYRDVLAKWNKAEAARAAKEAAKIAKQNEESKEEPGKKPKRKAKVKPKKEKPVPRIVICGYEMASSIPVEVFRLRNIATLVCDESQNLKNHESKKTAFFKEMAPSCKHIMCVSGTPLQYPVHLAVLTSAMRPDQFGSFDDYTKRYCKPFLQKIGSWPDGTIKTKLNLNGSANLDELHKKLVTHVMFRKRKGDVDIKLPPKVRNIVNLVNTSDETKDEDKPKEMKKEEIIQALIDNARVKKNMVCAEIERFVRNDMKDPTDKLIIFATRTVMSKALCKTVEECGYTLSAASARASNKTASKKETKKETKKAAKDSDGDESMSSSEPGSDSDAIVKKKTKGKKPKAPKRPLRYITIDGSVSTVKRNVLARDFQSNPDTRIAILSLPACNSGLNLFAANHVFFAELDYEWSTMEQGEDRAHRFGQWRTVNTHFLIAKGTVDDHVWDKILMKKMRISAQVIDGIKDVQFKVRKVRVECS